MPRRADQIAVVSLNLADVLWKQIGIEDDSAGLKFAWNEESYLPALDLKQTQAAFKASIGDGESGADLQVFSVS